MVAGQAVHVTIPIQWQDRGVKVPRDALIADPEQARLVRITDGKADVLPVEVLVSTYRRDVLESLRVLPQFPVQELLFSGLHDDVPGGLLLRTIRERLPIDVIVELDTRERVAVTPQYRSTPGPGVLRVSSAPE